MDAFIINAITNVGQFLNFLNPIEYCQVVFGILYHRVSNLKF
jgi:hypothetical protein